MNNNGSVSYDPSRTFTVNDLMARWQCARATVLRAIHSGGLKAFRIGGRDYRVIADELKRFEKQRAA